MDESWGLKSLLDTADDTAVFIVNDRTDTILYCNYYTTLKTGAHEGSQLKSFWDDIRPQMKECGEGRTYRFTSEHTPFGDNKNVTITRVVWTGGVKAYAFLVTNHLENKEERDREIIFKALGKSYISIHVFDEESRLVYTIFRSDAKDVFYFRPEPYKELMDELLEKYIHPDDIPGIEKIKNIEEIEKELADDGKGLTMQFRRRTGDDYRWCEVGFSRVKGSDGKFKTVLTQRDIHTERIINNDKLSNKIIMDALANAYRSVYLVDLDDGSYSTVKPDELLFGIRDEGDYSDLMSIVEELIPDENQKDDLRGFFSLESLQNAFEGEADNIGREYPSVLTQEDGWMSINAFRPPSAPGLDNKCVVTFMDITEHKRVEKERNEQVIALDVL
ncbi:MAG: PAS domain-containing protein, partial [Lachnospiraceae bacterium]|nr:PAS domain-containing protein [Lachnospiraceae bacterium]